MLRSPWRFFSCRCYYFIFNAVVVCYSDIASTVTIDQKVEEHLALCPCCCCCYFALVIVWICYSNVVVCQKKCECCDVGRHGSIIFYSEPLVAMLVSKNWEVGGFICCAVDQHVGCTISIVGSSAILFSFPLLIYMLSHGVVTIITFVILVSLLFCLIININVPHIWLVFL